MSAFPIASRGFKLDDEVVRVAVGLKLRLDFCEPHQCQCGSVVDARGLHSFVCKTAPGRSARQRLGRSVFCRSLSACHKGARWDVQDGWEATGRPYIHPLVEREDIVFVCYSDLPYVNGAARDVGSAMDVATSVS